MAEKNDELEMKEASLLPNQADSSSSPKAGKSKKLLKKEMKTKAYKSQRENDKSILGELLELIKTNCKRKNQRHLRNAANQFSEPSLKRVLDVYSKGEKRIDDIIKQEIVVTAEHNILFIKRLRDAQSLDKPSEYDLLLPHSVLIHNLKTLQDHFLSRSFFFDVLSCPLDTDDLIKYIILNQLSTTLIGYESVDNVLLFSAVIVLPLIMLSILVYNIVDNMDDDADILNEQYTEARLAIKALVLIRLLLLILATSLATALLDLITSKVGGDIINYTTLSGIIVGLVIFIVAHETSKAMLGFKKTNSIFWFIPLLIFFITNLTITILSLGPQYFMLLDREIVNQDHTCPEDIPEICESFSCGCYRMFKSFFQTLIGILTMMGIPIGDYCCESCCGTNPGNTREIFIEECKITVPDNVQMRKMDHYRKERSNISTITEGDVRRVNEGWGDVNEIYKIEKNNTTSQYQDEEQGTKTTQPVVPIEQSSSPSPGEHTEGGTSV